MATDSRAFGRAFALLLAASLPLFFLWLGANSIWDANEAFYVDTPRHMVQSGDYVTPMFNGAERLNKPVLSYWIVAALYRVCGVSVTVERLGIALGIAGILVAAFLLGRAVRSTSTGVLAALIVATAPRVVMWGRRIFIDVYITLFMSLALACFVLAERQPVRRRTWLVLMYAAIGLGVLTKGPVALVLPAAVCAVWFTTERRWADARRLMIVPGALIILAIVAPWYAALVVRHGWAPVTSFFVGENLDRFTTSMQPDDRPFWFYLPVLMTDLFPWAPLLLVPVFTAWRRGSADPQPAARIRRLLWTWVVVIVAAFSCSQTKQDLYIFPVIAAAAALIADALVAARAGPRRRWLEGLLFAAALASAVAGGLVVRYFGSGGYYALDAARATGALLIAGGTIAAALCLWRRLEFAALALAAVFAAFNYAFVARMLPSVERLKPVVPIARAFLAEASPGARLGAYDFMLPSLVYYAGQPVEILASLDEVRTFYAGPRGAWAIMDAGRFDDVRAALPGVCVAMRHPRLDPRLGDVLNDRPPEDVLLVTNECAGRPSR